MRVGEAAEYLSISLRTLNERMASRKLGFIKLGKSVRFHIDDLNEYIDRNRVEIIKGNQGDQPEKSTD